MVRGSSLDIGDDDIHVELVGKLKSHQSIRDVFVSVEDDWKAFPPAPCYFGMPWVGVTLLEDIKG